MIGVVGVVGVVEVVDAWSDCGGKCGRVLMCLELLRC